MRDGCGIDLPPARGRVLRQVATSQFRFTLATNAARSALRPHTHEHPGVMFVVDGHVEETYGAQSLIAGNGALVLKSHDQRHANRFGPEGATVLVIDQLEPMPFLEAAPGRPTLREEPFMRMMGGLLARDLGDVGEACEIGLTSYAVDLLGVAETRRRLHPSPKIARAVELIHDNIGNVRRIDALARGVGAHPVYLARGFRERFGCSLQSYVLRVRLGRAADLVRDATRSLADIAVEVGFADQAHMTRAFRSYYGRTPGAFRV